MQPPPGRLHLLYHELRPGGSNYSYVLDTEEFSEQVKLLAHLRSQQESKLWPEITFDDGHISNFEFALPILQSHGFEAHFFITVGWTNQREGYMGWQELRALQQAGQRIGAHGWTHTLLTHCTGKDLEHELLDARLALEDKLGTSITTMSLPGGRYNQRILRACQSAGYTRVYTSTPQVQFDPASLTIGRLNIRGDMTSQWISNLFQPGSNVLSSLERQHRLKATAKSFLGDRLYAKLWALANRKEPEADR
jgi:peptidoglycan/xylan/chitin deacetylase (PgdA/CDA1 family)